MTIPPEVLDIAGDIGVWTLTGLLLVIGLVGSVLPILPGTLILMVTAVIHYFIADADQRPGVTGFVILGILLALSYILESMASAAGAKQFGSTKWGIIGALIGGVVGMFFNIPGLLLGPFIGAFVAELLIAKQSLKDSARSSHGAFWGTIGGMVAKAICALLMVVVFLVDCLWL
ncbi:DUF456 domain-containing protein [Sulfuriroseicoccus oceanibius]|uniref:DUF456 domain-containing protein n=1 Tax=Sulfuriroseicoccus oceanibius TaxID=2707525 RepID=A0A6B3LH07_9BACT|nr:DUF456 domain-containing protein [Sulfuriroseicoccus oceanibius]QQL45428.1 DUF456 domain-containing protein [Sulfuriroseicoccus oceanibius]